MTAIASIPDLEACIGAAGLPVKMKIIDHLDATARRWIAASPLAFVGVGTDDGPCVQAAGGPRGFATVAADGTLNLPLDAMDDLCPVEPGRGAGVLFLAPGVGETLRANGRIRAVTADRLELAVEECFVHCAKALIRSDFWRGAEPPPPADAEEFVNAARFLALATMDADGRIDISPKGDPAGLLIHLEAGRAALAERPGNRLAFGYRNMIEQPRVAALALIPGADLVATFAGRAHLSTDETLRSRFVVDGKTPILATVIDGASPVLRPSPALTRAEPWPCGPPADIDPAATFVAHVKLNKAKGAAATLLRLAANRRLISSGLEANYKSDLY